MAQYLCINFSQCLPKLFGLASQYHRLRAAVSGWDLDRDSSFLQDLLQGIPLGADDILVLGLLHLHCNGSSLLFLQGQKQQGINYSGAGKSNRKLHSGKNKAKVSTVLLQNPSPCWASAYRKLPAQKR